MPTLAFRRHDPWWDVDGSAARRRYRYNRFVGVLAFAFSIMALMGSGALWAIHLGFAGILGIQVPFGV
jgi:hypothetical protein